MARPQKVGLEYFNLDTIFSDDKIELMEAECGLVGFAILVKIWQKIYLEGYYIDWQEDNAILFARKINAEVTTVNTVITTCLSRNIFNKDLYNKYKILTSNGIQKRYLTIYKQLKRSYVPMIEEYLLVNTELKQVITELTSINPSISTQSKVKESKVNKSILKTTTKDKGACSSSSSKDNGADEPNNDLSKVATAFQSNGFGTINATVKDSIIELLDLYSTEWIMEAMKIAVEANKRSLRYVKGILENWTRSGGMKLTADKGASQYQNSNSIPYKKTRFHTVESRSESYSNDQMEEIIARKRREDREQRQGDLKLPKILDRG